MKPETYLNACIKATEAYHKKSYDIKYLDRKLRQVRAFRDRILRMFDTVHEYYEGLLDEGDEVNRQQIRRIAEQDLLLAQWESIDELNRERSQQRLQRIAELERELEEMEVDLNTAEDLAIHGPEGI